MEIGDLVVAKKGLVVGRMYGNNDLTLEMIKYKGLIGIVNSLAMTRSRGCRIKQYRGKTIWDKFWTDDMLIKVKTNGRRV